jgi:alkanesulfonate monooxygenase SsuD/methylene tetrahydromethanopterin reductase-like flavin-dependent oxidoreductase (luciferase family)
MRKLQFGYQVAARSAGDPATTPTPSHKLMLQDCINAEKLGFDSAWIPDHYYFERPWGLETFPDALTLLTAVAMKTERLKLGTMVVAATFRHPALLAKMCGAIQELSDGRLILGIGAGNQVHEHNAFDLPFATRVGRFKEYLAILTALWRGETVSMEGRHFTLREANLRTYVPKVPLLIAAGGEQMLGLTAKYADAWNPAGGVGWDTAAFSEKIAQLSAACKAEGRDIKDIEISHLSFLNVFPDSASANRGAEAMAEQSKTTPELLRKRTLVGTPDEVAAGMRKLVDLGVSHFMCGVGQVPDTDKYWDRVELLAREVLPKVRAA